MESKEGEEDEFCWIWRIKLRVLVALRRIFLLADLLIAADMWRTKCFIIIIILRRTRVRHFNS